MKKIVCTIGVMVAVFSARASYLYWSVGDQDSNISSATEWSGGYDVATVYAYETAQGKSSAQAVSSVETFAGESGIMTADLGSFSSSGYSFFIELAASKWSNMVVARSTTATTYDQLAQAGSVQSTATLSTIPAVSVWHGGPYTATPEPTSVMLMMLGVAGLALKRKRGNNA